MVMVTSCWVSPTVVTVNVSVSVSPAIERLHGGVAVVQRVDPQPGGGERIAAVAVGARCRADRRPGVVRIVEVGGAQIAGRSGCAGVTVVELARLHHRAGHRAGDVGGVVGAVDGDGHQLLGAANREDRKRIGQRLPDIARLHGGIVVVQRVGPDAGLRQRVGAELAPQRRVDGDPGVVRIVDVGRVQIARRGRGARCAVIDAAGLGHRPVGGADDHCGVVPAVDGDGHRLLGAVRCHRREGVDQRLARIERLHVRIAVVQRVGPQPGGGERVAAVAAAVGADRSPGVVRIVVDVGGIEVAGRGGRTVGVCDTAGLDHRPGEGAADHCGVVPAVDGDGHQLLGAVDRRGGERVGQRLPDIERLHGRIVVVQRVGPHPGCVDRERAVGACGREADHLPGIVRIVDIDGIEVPGIGRRARRSVGNTAGLHHRAGGVADDHRRDRVSLDVARRRGVARRVGRRDAGIHRQVRIRQQPAARNVDAEHAAGRGAGVGDAVHRQGNDVAVRDVAADRAGHRNRGVHRLRRVDDVVAVMASRIMLATGATVSTV